MRGLACLLLSEIFTHEKSGVTLRDNIGDTKSDPLLRK